MAAKQLLGNLVHASGIERLMHPPGTVSAKRCSDELVENDISVRARCGGVPCVKFIRHRFDPAYGDIGREIGVRAQQPTALAALTSCIEMCDLAARMHTGIRSTGAANFHRLVSNCRQRGFYASLNSLTNALPLPAIVRSTVVLDADSDSQSSAGQDGSESSSCCACCRCAASPSSRTSSRIERAPDGSPMST